MPQLDPSYVILGPAALVAGFIRGFAGFGGPLVLLPILSGYLPPAATMWVMMWVDLAVNVRLLGGVRQQVSSAVVIPLTLGTIAAMPLGVKMMAASDPSAMKRLLSAAVLIASLVLLSGWRYRGRASGATWTGVGVLSGLVMGATSLAVTAVLFLQADRQSAAESRANFIVWVFVATLALLGLLIAQSALRPGHIEVIAVLTPLYLLGTIIGANLQDRAPERLVRQLVLILAAAIGAAGVLI